MTAARELFHGQHHWFEHSGQSILKQANITTTGHPIRSTKSTPTMPSPSPPRRTKPRVILGTMTFGPDPSAGARITSLNSYKQVLDAFHQHGHTELDTARIYIGGQQEAFTREAGWKARGLSVATKWYPYAAGSDGVDIAGAHAAAVV